MNIKSLRDLCEKSTQIPPDTEFEYRKYKLIKCENGLTKNSNFLIFNTKNKHIETYEIPKSTADKAYTNFKNKLNYLIDCNPESRTDWVN